MRAPAASGDVRADATLIGREAELHGLVRNLRRGRHTLLLGPRGIGKTRLMREARGLFISAGSGARQAHRLGARPGLRLRPGQYTTLWIEHSAPLGDCLREMAEELLALQALWLDVSQPALGDWPTVKKELTRLGSLGVQRAVLESVRRVKPGCLIFFDSLDRITPSNQQFFEGLLTRAVLCAAAVKPREAFHFKKIWSSFARLELEPLSREESGRLVDHCLAAYHIRPVDPVLYRAEVIKSAGGNPFLIKNLLWLGSRDRQIGLEEIRQVRRTEEGELFNMGPLYILSASALTLSKIFSFGTDNREFYIYFSALGFLVYLLFRVFRTFFLFRPQRSA